MRRMHCVAAAADRILRSGQQIDIAVVLGTDDNDDDWSPAAAVVANDMDLVVVVEVNVVLVCVRLTAKKRGKNEYFSLGIVK